MLLFMRTEHYREDGFNMYTKILRKIIKIKRWSFGHCDGSGTGHCT